MGNKRKRVERLKTVAIIALTISAVLLSVRTQTHSNVSSTQPLGWVGQLLAYIFPDDGMDGAALGGDATGVEGLHPVRVMIRNEQGQYGQQYNTAAVNSAFERLGTVLGTALNRGQDPERISEQQWYDVLNDEPYSVYFDFLGQMSLPILAQWLGSDMTHIALMAQCRELILAGEPDGVVTVYYSDPEGGAYYAAETTLALRGSLDTALEQFVPNGAIFACQSEGWEGLAPNVIVQSEALKPIVFQGGNPLVGLDNEEFESLLRSLSFSPKTSSVYPSADGQKVVQEGDSTLRISADGVVTYRETDPSGRYPVATWQENSSLTEQIECARQLVSASVSAHCGAGGLYLTDVVVVDEGRTELYFDYLLEGAQVQLAHQNYAACVVIEGNFIAEYTLVFRNYQPQDEYQVVLPLLQAVAAMDALDVTGGELVLRYRDWGTDPVIAGWVVQP